MGFLGNFLHFQKHKDLIIKIFLYLILLIEVVVYYIICPKWLIYYKNY